MMTRLTLWGLFSHEGKNRFTTGLHIILGQLPELRKAKLWV